MVYPTLWYPLCYTLYYVIPCIMVYLILWYTSTKVYLILQHTLSHGIPYLMGYLISWYNLHLILWDILSYGVPYLMAYLILWDTLSYGIPYLMGHLILWHTLSYGTPYLMVYLILWVILSYRIYYLMRYLILRDIVYEVGHPLSLMEQLSLHLSLNNPGDNPSTKGRLSAALNPWINCQSSQPPRPSPSRSDKTHNSRLYCQRGVCIILNYSSSRH